MKKFLVEDVNVGVTKGGFACGPVAGNVVAEVRIHDLENDTVKYHSLAEVEGTLNFFETGISTYDLQMRNDVDDEEGWDMLSEHSSGGFSDYSEFFENLDELRLHDEDHVLIWKYLVYMVRAGWEEIEQMKAESIGRCLGGFEIPVCDAEQNYLDELDEEEIEEDDPDAGSLEEYRERLNDEFFGSKIDMDHFDDLDEDESPEGCYSSYVKFHEGDDDYRLQYSFWVNEEAKITSIEWLKCEKLIGEEYVVCPDGEVDAKRIYEEMCEEMDSWL